MATYTELYKLALEDSVLRNKITTACIIAAEAIRGEDAGTANHANRLIWSKNVFENPAVESNRMLWAALAANNTLTVAQIQSASDASLQTVINSAVNLFATGE
jgi:hypothetical protein